MVVIKRGDITVFSLFYSGCVRIFAGLLGDKSPVRRNILAGVAASYGGLLTVISLSFKTFPTLLTFSVLYAIGGGMFVFALVSIVEKYAGLCLINDTLNTGLEDLRLCGKGPRIENCKHWLIYIETNPTGSKSHDFAKNVVQCSGANSEQPTIYIFSNGWSDRNPWIHQWCSYYYSFEIAMRLRFIHY